MFQIMLNASHWERTLAACDSAQPKCIETECELRALSQAMMAFRQGTPLHVSSRI